MPDVTRNSYHHGALREELLRACLRLVETEGIGAVSLRRVARAAGVSPGAPYHHFPDRAALLAAISARGFESMTARMLEVKAAAAEPVAALGALVECYIQFARDEPAYFQLMFRPELSQPDKHPDTEKAGDAAFDVLTEAIRDCVRAGVIEEDDAGAVAVAAWSTAHGLASLYLDGQLDRRTHVLGNTVDAIIPKVARLLESALRG